MPLQHARRRDADDAAVPAFSVYDDAKRLAQRRLFCQTALDLIHDAPFFQLALGIQRVKAAGNLSALAPDPFR